MSYEPIPCRMCQTLFTPRSHNQQVCREDACRRAWGKWSRSIENERRRARHAAKRGEA